MHIVQMAVWRKDKAVQTADQLVLDNHIAIAGYDGHEFFLFS